MVPAILEKNSLLIAAVLLVTFTVLDEALPPGRCRFGWRPSVRGCLFVVSCDLGVLLHAYYAGGIQSTFLPGCACWPIRFAGVCRPCFLALVADVHRRALRAASAAHAAELARAQLAPG